MRVSIEQTGMDRARGLLRSISRNARHLYPLANQIRQRWHESEQRTFAARTGWEPRKASTVRRYQYPVKTLNGVRKGRSKGRGPGFFTGGLHRGLTRPHQKGIRDSVVVGRGKLTAIFGIKGGREPRAYGNWQGEGARGARPGLVSFDETAVQQGARDTEAHIFPDRERG